MSRIKIFVAALLVTAAVVFGPSHAAAADTVELAIAGSSAMWQTAGLATFQRIGTGNTGACTGLGITVIKPCFHYTTNAKFSLNDTRPTKIGGSTNVDTGTLWIVWDSSTTSRHVWVYSNVDSVVGDRCFFAQPRCTITVPSGYIWGTVGAQIPTSLWGTDTVPPADVQALFGGLGVSVNTAATDIRPDDAQFVICRVDSNLGHGSETASHPDGLDGLGYATNPTGTCPTFASISLANGVGNPIQSGFSTSTANPLAFNISGHDPFTNTAIPAFDVINFGAAPIVFLFSRSSTINTGLKGAADATDAQLQAIFSGTNCDANVLAGTKGPAPINAFLREPLSGTMNTTEASVFRRPVDTVAKTVIGLSQETGVGTTNPLSVTPCTAGGARSRAIGTGQMVGTAVKNAGGGAGGTGENGNDGIGYAFFSFGNVSSISGSANFGYLTLDGQDPIGLGTVNQELPVCAYPCPESAFPAWISGKTLQSFPSLRTGKYTAWSLLRMVTISGKEALVEDLAKASFTYDVNFTSDFIPVGETVDSHGNTDPGLIWWHTHYQQRDANGLALGGAPTNGTFPAHHNPGVVAADHGGDMGGCTITTTGITATTKIKFIQANVVEPYAVTCSLDRN
jgi:hypothetical protein